jgi:CBS domain-containing protein
MVPTIREHKPLVPAGRDRPVAAVMHRGVVSCVEDAAALTAARMMAAHRIHAVVVVNRDGNCVSVIGTGDVVRAAQDGSLQFALSRAIGRPPVLVDPTTPLRRAIQLMHRHDVDHVVVTQRARSKPIGVLSILDAIDAF